MTEEAKKDKGFFSRALDKIAPPQVDGKPENRASAVTTATTTESKKVSAPPIDIDMYNSIKDALKSRGKVFHDFMDKTEQMKSIIPDEVARIKATVIAMSVSKEALSSAINEIRTGLTVEKGEFNVEIEKATKLNAGINSNIDILSRKLEDLQKTEALLTEQKAALEAELAEKTRKVEAATGIFESTIATISSEIDSLESKLSYI